MQFFSMFLGYSQGNEPFQDYKFSEEWYSLILSNFKGFSKLRAAHLLTCL